VYAANKIPLVRVVDGDGGEGPGRLAGPGGRGGRALRLLRGGDAVQSDDDLLRDFHAGRESAFADLVRRHERAVRAVVRRYAERPDDVLDLAQRAFLRALQAARRARLLPFAKAMPFRPLLLRIAVNLGKNEARDAARWRRTPLEALAGAPGGAAAAAVAPQGTAALEEAERARAVKAAVERLPRRQRQVLRLRIDAELPFADIARALGITENNAKVHFHHATRRLAAIVAGDGEETP
jgi:RNA polymerase sigma-70 factor, ECF subfamily